MMTSREYRRMIRRRWLKVCGALMFLSFVLGAAWATAQPWPAFDTKWKFEIQKTSGAEMTDVWWMHLHEGHAGEDSVGLKVEITDHSPNTLDPSIIPPGNQIRYTVRGVPVSPWLDTPWTYTLAVTNPDLPALDGIHDISLEVQGPDRARIRPLAAYLHLFRGRAVEPTVPIIGHNATGRYDDYTPDFSQGPLVVYVNRTARNHVAYPLDPTLVPWSTPPLQSDLYQEEVAPHSDLFGITQLWWGEPEGTVSEGLSFIRGLGTKFGGNHTDDIYNWKNSGGPQDPTAFGFAGQRNFPYRDGGRGIGWGTGYVTGEIDEQGYFFHIEKGGPLRVLTPLGEFITLAGWRVTPGKDPVWIEKPRNWIRENMELRGTWPAVGSGQYAEPADQGFHYPTDVAIDPMNSNIVYVAEAGGNMIWKVTIADRTNWAATVEVFAGALNHTPGFADGTGTAARFNFVTSIVFDDKCDCIYAADTKNDAVRKITRSGVVTTLFGSPGMGNRLATRGLPVGPGTGLDGGTGCFNEFGIWECYDAQSNRTVSPMNISAAQAAAGTKPEIYRPMCIRTDSQGNIILLDSGFSALRRIHPTTGESKLLLEVPTGWERWKQDWTWIAVNKYPGGNAGPLDSIYIAAENMPGPVQGENRVNEQWSWVPASGGPATWLFGPDWSPYPDGWGRTLESDPPHYPWMVTIDRRGALYLSGSGETGMTRVRMRRPTDPFATNWIQYFDGKMEWLKGKQPGGFSYSLEFGWECHNYLGFPDCWGLQDGVTDDQIKATFKFQGSTSPAKEAAWLNFVKLNSGKKLGAAPPPTPDTQPPTMPLGLTASAVAQTSLTLTWQASTDNVGVTGYRITRNGTSMPTTIQTTQNETGLTPATAYAYTVVAQDAAGNLSPAASLTVTTPVAPAPQPGYADAKVGHWPVGGVTLGCSAIGTAVEATAALDMVKNCVGH